MNLNQDFDIIKTTNGLSSTFLSLLRTGMVLAGISALLIRKKKAVLFNRFYIFILFMLILLSTWEFYKNTIYLKKFHIDLMINFKWHWITPIAFAILLMTILIVLILID